MIDDYLEILTDEEVKYFVAINFIEYIKFIKEEKSLRKIAKWLYNFLKTPDEVQSNSSDNCIHHYKVKILNLFDTELQLIYTKPVIKTKLKSLLNQLKKFKVQAALVLDYKIRNDSQMFHSCAKLTGSDLAIDEAFKSMHHSIITKIKNKHIFECENKEIIWG